MVYLGISITKLCCATMAWQLKRELGSKPQARSSKSSSVSSKGLSELNPSRTITWQVVQAQLMSQACSMLIWLSNKASQIVVPAGTSSCAPCGQSSAWGNICMTGIKWTLCVDQTRHFECLGSCVVRQRLLYLWLRLLLRLLPRLRLLIF